VVLDEAVEGVEPHLEPGRRGLPGAGDRREAVEELAGVEVEELGEEVLLRLEVLVDERLRDPCLARDVVDRGGVVPTLGDDAQGGVEDGGPALLAGETLAGGAGCDVAHSSRDFRRLPGTY
jgi:hypothetical protein